MVKSYGMCRVVVVAHLILVSAKISLFLLFMGTLLNLGGFVETGDFDFD